MDLILNARGIERACQLRLATSITIQRHVANFDVRIWRSGRDHPPRRIPIGKNPTIRK